MQLAGQKYPEEPQAFLRTCQQQSIPDFLLQDGASDQNLECSPLSKRGEIFDLLAGRAHDQRFSMTE